MKILIIDDDHVIRVMLRGILSGCADLEVEEVSSGAAAWERFQQPQPPDLCILDNMMSDVTGLDLLQRIRSSPRLASLPIIFCSSCSDKETIVSAARGRVAHFIVKPFSRETVLAKVLPMQAELLAKRSLEDETQVCARLEATGELYRERLSHLLFALNEGTSRLWRELRVGLGAVAAVPLASLKRDCADLGANPVLTQLAHAESALQQCEFIAREEDWPPSPEHLEQLRGWVVALAKLREESQRLLEAAAAKGIFPAKPAPPPSPAPAPASTPETPTPSAADASSPTSEGPVSSPPAVEPEVSNAI